MLPQIMQHCIMFEMGFAVNECEENQINGCSVGQTLKSMSIISARQEPLN